MVSRISRPLVQALGCRRYGSAAAVLRQSSTVADVEEKTLPNNLRIATIPNSTSLARIGVVCKVGPRTEPPGYEGAAHLLRQCAAHRTKGPLAEEILGVIDHRGARFKVIQTREHTLYYIECAKEFGGELGEYLRALVTAPSFADIDILPMKRMIAESLDNLGDPLISAFELLHKAAYRQNLGNSLYCPTYNFNKFETEQMTSFFLSNMTLNNMVFVGDGLDMEDLTSVGNKFLPLEAHLLTPYNVDKGTLEALQGLPPGSVGDRIQSIANNMMEKLPLKMSSKNLPVEATPEVGLVQSAPDYQDAILQELKELYAKQDRCRLGSKYVADELREIRSSKNSAAFIASEGASMNTKDALVADILRHVMGGNIRVKYGTGSDENRLAKAVGDATGGTCSASAFNANYTDSGLFGFGVAGPENTLEKGIRAALKEFGQITKSGGIQQKDLDKAKTAYKSELCMQYEQAETGFQAMAFQSITGAKYKFLPDLLAEVDQVSLSDVSTAAKKFVTGKPSMSAVGRVSALPYLDQLFS